MPAKSRFPSGLSDTPLLRPVVSSAEAEQNFRYCGAGEFRLRTCEARAR